MCNLIPLISATFAVLLESAVPMNNTFGNHLNLTCPQGFDACQDNFTFVKLGTATAGACFLNVHELGDRATNVETCGALAARIPVLKTKEMWKAYLAFINRAESRNSVSFYIGLTYDLHRGGLYWDDGSQFVENDSENEIYAIAASDFEYRKSPCAFLNRSDGKLWFSSCEQVCELYCEGSFTGLPAKPTIKVKVTTAEESDISEGDRVKVTCSADLRTRGELSFVFFFKDKVDILSNSDSRVSYSLTIRELSEHSPCSRTGNAVLQLEADASFSTSYIGCVSYIQNGVDLCSLAHPYCTLYGPLVIKAAENKSDNGNGDEEEEEKGEDVYKSLLKWVIPICLLFLVSPVFIPTGFQHRMKRSLQEGIR